MSKIILNLALIGIGLLLSPTPLSASGGGLEATRGTGISSQPLAPTPTVDRLAIPALPENPTQVELGQNLYYYHCMPCHGDRGQGLTDEWRQAWVEDHQNCWARGCHGGRLQDEGFPLPTVVPAVSGPGYPLQSFSKPLDLYEYLRTTHPPQRPGELEEDEYWALTAYLLAQNGRLSPRGEVGPQATHPTSGLILLGIGGLLGTSIATLLVVVVRSRRKAIRGTP